MTAANSVSHHLGVQAARHAAHVGANLNASSSLDRQLAAPGALARFGSPPGSAHTVKAGDTLDRIARAHGTTWQTLARINGIDDPNRIFPGQSIRLPTGGSTIHSVKPGDTLGAIAAANGTTVGALVHANGLTNPDMIHPGQQIWIGGGPSDDISARRSTPPPAAAGTTQGAPAAPTPAAPPVEQAGGHRLGSLSEVHESGGNGPGTVSTGVNDPGGVSYGIYQLSSNAGTLRSFMGNEGARWAGELSAAPGSRAFSDAWRAIAAREPEAFRAAQHSFIQRTHYEPAVAAVAGSTGLDLNARHDAVRDATWSVSVQHAGAAIILNRAVAATDAQLARTDPGYDRALINNIYAARTDYVLNVARTSTSLTAGERAQLVDVTRNRYPAELAQALAMLDAQPQAAIGPGPAVEQTPTGTIDGNVAARDNGVAVKSARVQMDRLDASMGPVIAAVAQAARELGLPQPVITSANDSRHSDGSLHYRDRALDFRGNNISLADGQRLEARVNQILGAGYDVDFETFANASNNHLHVEYDPD